MDAPLDYATYRPVSDALRLRMLEDLADRCAALLLDDDAPFSVTSFRPFR